MNTTRIAIVAGLILLCLTAWRVGANASNNAMMLMTGMIFGSMVGIPAMLIVLAKPQRHEHYHRVITETPTEPQQQPVALIPASTHYIVLDDEKAQLQAATQLRIEVSR